MPSLGRLINMTLLSYSKPTGTFCEATACGSPFVGILQRRCRSRLGKNKVKGYTLADKRRIELLVDADNPGIPAIREAIKGLVEAKGAVVHTTLFAEPRRVESTKWKQFEQSDPTISFRAVPREGVCSQPNDEAMISRVEELCQLPSTTSIAVFSRDSVLVAELVALSVKHDTRIVVVGPELPAFDADAERFASMGAEVLRCKLEREVPIKVRAVLHLDGTGEVRSCTNAQEKLCSGWLQRNRDMMDFLHSYDCPVTEQTLHTVAIKFWYQQPVKKLASLAVFPPEATYRGVHDMIADREWSPQKWHRELAYCLPLTSLGNTHSKQVQDRYGSILQRRIFHGGGPFMLEHSDCLVPSMLTRLGFLDSGLNSDIREAMFLFMNGSHNKSNLRRVGLLDKATLPVSEASALLHSAFLSNRTCGWQRAPADDMARKVLVKARLMHNLDVPKPAFFDIMQRYVAGLDFLGLRIGPKLQTYNGLVWSILREAHGQQDPKKREIVQITDNDDDDALE